MPATMIRLNLVKDTYKEIVAKYDKRGKEAVSNIDRFDSYDEAKKRGI